jgi:hypothetical protein
MKITFSPVRFDRQRTRVANHWASYARAHPLVQNPAQAIKHFAQIMRALPRIFGRQHQSKEQRRPMLRRSHRLDRGFVKESSFILPPFELELLTGASEMRNRAVLQEDVFALSLVHYEVAPRRKRPCAVFYNWQSAHDKRQ